MGRYTKSRRGFTLIEAAIVIGVGGIMLATSAAAMSHYLNQRHILTTKERMSTIKAAMSEFLEVNKRFPCPASLSSPPDDAEYGREIPKVNCDGFSTVGLSGVFAINGNFLGGAPGEFHIWKGAVPVRSLNLSDDFMDDGWGDRFIYAVTANDTVAYDPEAARIYVVKPCCGGLIIVDLPSGYYPHYIIVSLGADRKGAYSHEGKPRGDCIGGDWVYNLNCSYNSLYFLQTPKIGTKNGDLRYDDYLDYQLSASGPVGKERVFTGSVVIYPALACPSGWRKIPRADIGGLLALTHSYCQKE